MKKRKKRLTKVLFPVLAIASAFGIADRKMDLYNKQIPVKTQEGEIKAPVYNIFTGLHPGNCSAYVRKAGAEIFNKNYSFSSAWNRRYHDKVISQVKNFSELDGKIEPGMIVGFYNPKSRYNKALDEKGRERKYSHVALYLGDGKFAHQLGAKTRVDTASDLEKLGWVPREIIDSN